VDGFLTAMLAMQKLLKFAAMRDKEFRADEAYQLALISSVARLYRASGRLPGGAITLSASQAAALGALRSECAALDDAVRAGARYKLGVAPAALSAAAELPGLADIWRTLQALSDYAAQARSAGQAKLADPMLAPDAFTNPVYARFALKTLLAVLIGYVFYNAAEWQGIHTVMLTCLIVALPSLGASTQKSVLRVGGALVGSALALFMEVFVIPRIDSIVSLLLMALPVIALGAWAAAGSERISYAGIQLMFTFSLALLERFSPATDLTEIRDRIIGILLGVGLSVAVQALVWPEGEADMLRAKLAGLLRALAALVRSDAGESHLGYVEQHLRTWSGLQAAEAVLARVSIEPDWRDGENERVT
jgi:multidrug resistance protein MdtO